MSPSRVFPEASVSALLIMVWPAPSATTTTALPRSFTLWCRASRKPAGPSRPNGTSGISTKSASWLANAA